MTFKSQDDNKNSFDVALNGAEFRLNQDVQAYKDYAAQSREIDQYKAGARTSYRPFCIIPDIVSIDIKLKYGIDIHAPEFSHDAEAKRRFTHIIRTEYPELLTGSAANLSVGSGNSGGPAVIIK